MLLQGFAESLQQDSSNQSEIVMIKLYCCGPGYCSRYPLLYYFFQIRNGLGSSVFKLCCKDSAKPCICRHTWPRFPCTAKAGMWAMLLFLIVQGAETGCYISTDWWYCKWRGSGWSKDVLQSEAQSRCSSYKWRFGLWWWKCHCPRLWTYWQMNCWTIFIHPQFDRNEVQSHFSC